MKPQRHSRRFVTRHSGAALVISLLLLLVMTLLGLGASQSTRLQERMAGNQRDQELALQTAEAALRYAESKLSSTATFVKICEAERGDVCDAYEMRTLVDAATRVPLDLAQQSEEWWDQWGRELGSDSEDGAVDYEIGGVVTTPELVVERYAEVPDVLSVGDSSFDVVREFYAATARSKGQTETAQVVIQSTYARIAFD